MVLYCKGKRQNKLRIWSYLIDVQYTIGNHKNASAIKDLHYQ